jgi:hypothetical protein
LLLNTSIVVAGIAGRNRWDEKAGLRRDAISFRVINALDAREIGRSPMKKLSKTFLETCGEGVDRLGTEEHSERITIITARYTVIVEHGSGCDNCNEASSNGHR